jgi:putative flippase GtrA
MNLSKVKKLLSYPLSKLGYLGILTYLNKILLTVIFTELLNIDYKISYAIVLVITVLVNYIILIKLVFNKDFKREYFYRYVIAIFSINLVDYALVYSVTTMFMFNYKISIITFTILMFFVKFILFKVFVFKEKLFF